MKMVLVAMFCFCGHWVSAQKLSVISLESILYSSIPSGDSLLTKSKFKLTDKENGEGFHNYYYTSYEKIDKSNQFIRSLSVIDVYSGADTSRLVLYRTYNKNDQEEMIKQLFTAGYIIFRRSGNDFIYTKGDRTITHKISEKKTRGGKLVTAYEFELGR
jgi:hypothetical protein